MDSLVSAGFTNEMWSSRNMDSHISLTMSFVDFDFILFAKPLNCNASNFRSATKSAPYLHGKTCDTHTLQLAVKDTSREFLYSVPKISASKFWHQGSGSRNVSPDFISKEPRFRFRFWFHRRMLLASFHSCLLYTSPSPRD